MRWRRAWTGELATGHYSKLDITLDEEDLHRLAAEHLPGVDPRRLSVAEAWRLLEQEAETLLAMEQTVRLHHNVEDNGKLIVQLHTERNTLLAELRDKYAPVEP